MKEIFIRFKEISDITNKNTIAKRKKYKENKKFFLGKKKPAGTSIPAGIAVQPFRRSAFCLFPRFSTTELYFSG